MSPEKPGYSTTTDYDDPFWPGRLVLRSEEVAKFESTALAHTVSKLLNDEYFPSNQETTTSEASTVTSTPE